MCIELKISYIGVWGPLTRRSNMHTYISADSVQTLTSGYRINFVPLYRSLAGGRGARLSIFYLQYTNTSWLWGTGEGKCEAAEEVIDSILAWRSLCTLWTDTVAPSSVGCLNGKRPCASREAQKSPRSWSGKGTGNRDKPFQHLMAQCRWRRLLTCVDTLQS